ncbi:hypothetical protein C7W88_22090 (plasmid) [Novosphingobium sp. THN1]|nr:hypothetical protein C7W88_22090 [Novosphingobium sp. THN1]
MSGFEAALAASLLPIEGTAADPLMPFQANAGMSASAQNLPLVFGEIDYLQRPKPGLASTGLLGYQA